MAIIYFNGCSFTEGSGFSGSKSSPLIYPNLLTNDAINEAEECSSNLKIFSATARAIIDNFAPIYVVQWSALHQHWLYPSADSGYYIGTNYDNKDDFVAQFQLLNHDYGNILQLITYTRILENMARCSGAKLIFVNGLVHWSREVEWMYNLVGDIKSGPDRYVENLENNYDLVNWNQWINPWTPLQGNELDFAPLDNIHPGPLTHKQLAELINERL